MTGSSKKTALQLHGLSRGDQKWLLRQLPKQQRKQIEAHLAELSNMGLPAMESLQIEEGPEVQRESSNGRASDTRSATSLLDSIPENQMFERLEDEPDWVVALILAGGEWTWTRGFLARMDTVRRGRVCRLAEESARFRLLQETLVKLLAREADTEDEDIPVVGRFDYMLRDIEQNLQSTL